MTNRAFARNAATLIASATLFAVSTAATAAADPVARGKAQVQEDLPAAKDDKRLFCVVDKVTGSHLPRKTCKTRARWMAETGVDPARIR